MGGAQLDRIQAARSVVVARERGRRAYWRLGDATDWQLRSLIGMPGWGEMLRAMRVLAAHEDANQGSALNLVPETWLTGADGWGTRHGGGLLVALEEMFLPALVRGWATAWSDCVGAPCTTPPRPGGRFWLPQATRRRPCPSSMAMRLTPTSSR